MGAHVKAAGSSTREVLDSLRRIVQTLRESSRRAEQALGISGAQLFVMERLADAPSMSVNELAARTHTHQSSVSTVVARLVARGLVARRRSAGDARRLELVLTTRGHAVVRDTPGAAQGDLIRTIEALPAASRTQLATLLKSVAGGIDAQAHRPRMFFDDPRKGTTRRHV